MGTLEDRLQNQRPPNFVENNLKNSNGVNMQTLQINAEVGKWSLVLPENRARRFLSINNRGGDLGPCNVEMAFDRQVRGIGFSIDDSFNPYIAPTNAIYVYVTDPDVTGSTNVNLQVIEG